jgi:hypothetical protein
MTTPTPITASDKIEWADEQTSFTVHSLDGAHLRLSWCDDADAALFIFRTKADPDSDSTWTEITAPVLRELAALVQHPQFAAALAAVDRPTNKPPVIDAN